MQNRLAVNRVESTVFPPYALCCCSEYQKSGHIMKIPAFFWPPGRALRGYACASVLQEKLDSDNSKKGVYFRPQFWTSAFLLFLLHQAATVPGGKYLLIEKLVD
jgi:hypothetical protein